MLQIFFGSVRVNVKVLENKVDRGVRTGVEMVPRDYSGTQWKEKWKKKVQGDIGSVNILLSMGSYLENTVNTVIGDTENTVIDK